MTQPPSHIIPGRFIADVEAHHGVLMIGYTADNVWRASYTRFPGGGKPDLFHATAGSLQDALKEVFDSVKETA